MTSPGAGGKVKRIIVGVDGSEHAERALEWAAEQAQRTGAALEIHTAYEPGYAFATSEEVEMAMRRVLEQATEAAAGDAPEGRDHHDQPPRGAGGGADRGQRGG